MIDIIKQHRHLWLFFSLALIATFQVLRDKLWQTMLSPQRVSGSYRA